MEERTQTGIEHVGNATVVYLKQITIESYVYGGKKHWDVMVGKLLMASASSEKEAREKATAMFHDMNGKIIRDAHPDLESLMTKI